MIQRIQTLYLLSALILLVVLQFVPLALFSSADASAILYAGGYATLEAGTAAALPLAVPQWLVPLLLAGAALPALIAIFLYRKRRVQMRLCLLAVVLTLAAGGALAAQILLIGQIYSDMHVTLSAALFIVVLLLLLLARHRIGKDEALVRSLDRIR